MNEPKRVLVLYYSLTHQTEKVLEKITTELTAVGHTVDMRKIKPIPEWTLPLKHGPFFWNWTKVWVGMNLTQPIEHMDLKADDYDYIVLGFQPWNLAPSIPMNSFLDSPMAEIFRGKKVIGVVTCRTRWERSYRIAKEKIAKRGGQLVDGLVIMNTEREPFNMITTVNFLFYGGPKAGSWQEKYLKPYGIDEAAVEVARDFGHELAHRMLEDTIRETKGWRLVNKPLQLV